MRRVAQGKSCGNLFELHPEWAQTLLDFFLWKNDPTVFEWSHQGARWQTNMRYLSFLVWNLEIQMGKCAWACGKGDGN